MTRRKTLYLWAAACAAGTLLLASCAKEYDELSAGEFAEGELVDVTIDVCAGSLTAMTGTSETRSYNITVGGSPEDIVCEAVRAEDMSFGTKAINDPTPTSTTTIKNLWVLQYDGVGDNAKLLTSRYIEDYSQANRTVKLIGSTSPCIIAFLANTYDSMMDLPVGHTISELKGYRFTTQSLETIVTYDPNTQVQGGTDFPNNRDYYQRLNGFDTTAVTTGCVLSSELQHNLCRISVNVTNNTAGTTYPVTLTSADIENVPGCVYFVTDYSGYTSGTAVGKPTQSDLSHYGQSKFTEVIEWSGSEGTSTSTKSAKLYLPANESGTLSYPDSVRYAKLKSLFAPSRATMLRIRGTYKDSLSQDIPITYSFALGENMTNNYQLVPNGDYVYNITLNARGDKTTDGRVSYGSSSGVDYTDTASWPLANCYICNPPVTGSATYKIPVVRVDQFWGNHGYENVSNNTIRNTGTWTVSVIWSDMEVNASNFVLTKSSGTGVGSYPNFNYFEVQIPSTSVKGNVVIGIRNGNSSDWLWSWHLWVTDYCPDEAKYLSQQGAFLSGTDTYQITGGKVQRYTKGATKVYMDRCIGAMDPDATGYARGTMYYQFGRKDPFPVDSDEYYAGGNVQQSYTVTTIAYDSPNITTQPQNVQYSVINPTTFITSTSTACYWTYGDKYNPSIIDNNIVWQDPNYSSNGNKSIFDPSPSGWKVTTSHSGLSYNSFSNGICYANTGEGGKATVALPAHGYRGYSNGSLVYGSSYGYYWSSSPSGVSDAYFLYFYSGYLYAHLVYINYYGPQRATGEPVRPVQE